MKQNLIHLQKKKNHPLSVISKTKKMINLNNKIINTVPFKHKLIHPKLPDNKKLKKTIHE